MIKRKKKWLGVFAALVMILSVCGLQETVLASERLTEKRVVVLDPGHGGNDAGACAWYNGYLYQEAAINWKIAWYTMQELKKYPYIEVHLTRGENQAQGLVERVLIAKNYNADLLVSQHINDAGSPWPRGASVLVSSGTYRSYLAEKEKIFAGYVLEELGKLGINRRYPETGGLEYRLSENGSHYPNGAIRDYYAIVAQSVEQDLPGVIIEHAFVSNASDASNYFRTEEQLQKLGQADANAIVRYFKKISSNDQTKDTVIPDAKNGWKQIKGDYYYYINGKKQRNRLLNLDDGIYYVDQKGKRYSGWKTVDKKRYYFQPKKDGKACTYWLKYRGQFYYFNASGVMFKNAQLGSAIKHVYLFGANGRRCSGWCIYRNEKYYIDAAGYAHTGWLKYRKKWYYFNKKTGVMYKNCMVTAGSGKQYKFNKNGVCVNR